ncbi:hypothetical protein BJY04DRAFT_224025 [Aspergillus karnatakaensis]|uniref:Zn(II)2Cys6 transcription factor n=1 Tax=Aspergillus karnatakaensis TaxID=1810916 RepID=UPI003CCE3E3A
MVYRGKPSRACLECRVKRRKCDLSKPACGQCTRAGSKCDGYRDQNSLNFRDQTAQTLSKPQYCSHNRRPVTSFHENPAVFTDSARRQQALEPDNDPWRAISVPPQQLALSFYFYHYLMSGSGPALSHPDCVSIVHAGAREGGYIADLIKAVGMASLAYVQNAPSLTRIGGQMYSEALRHIRVALADPVEAASDQLLVAVMLLVLYETVICNPDKNLSPWDSHVDGALALVELRGISQFRNRIGRSIFLYLRTEVLVDCLQRGRRVPVPLTEWMSEFQAFESAQDAPTGRLAGILVSACAVLASVKKKASDQSDISGFIPALLFIDEALDRWAGNLPVEYRYKALATRDKDPDIMSEPYDLYPSLEMAHTWNLQRCARITLHQTLLEILSSSQPTLSLPPDGHLQTSRHIIEQNANDIYHSVPYILHYCNKLGTSGDMRAVHVMPLLWPLYVAGAAPTTTNSAREYIIEQVRRIEQVTGIQRAKSLALELEKGMFSTSS